jgi:hypothetical protein
MDCRNLAQDCKILNPGVTLQFPMPFVEGKFPQSEKHQGVFRRDVLLCFYGFEVAPLCPAPSIPSAVEKDAATCLSAEGSPQAGLNPAESGVRFGASDRRRDAQGSAKRGATQASSFGSFSCAVKKMNDGFRQINTSPPNLYCYPQEVVGFDRSKRKRRGLWTPASARVTA